MGLPVYNSELSSEVGINPHYNIDTDLETATKHIIKIVCTPKSLLRKYFLKAPIKARLLTYYQTLMFIHSKPRCTTRYICDTTGNDNKTISNIVILLIEYGYIKIVPRRTFVIPFNAYKIDKTYVITPKGKTVLHKLINY